MNKQIAYVSAAAPSYTTERFSCSEWDQAGGGVSNPEILIKLSGKNGFNPNNGGFNENNKLVSPSHSWVSLGHLTNRFHLSLTRNGVYCALLELKKKKYICSVIIKLKNIMQKFTK